ncbi:hypothetical protein [Bacteroides sp.]|uniref:hypothetical protein n=1 Tax=Bacteroides sp. TaxID=29523 RepID=UPI003FA5A5C0
MTIKHLFIAAMCILLASCNCNTNCNTKTETKAMFQKKYTNADFYKDGVFQQDVAKKAFYEMFEYYGYPVTELIEKEAWYTDFGLGDFENCGMGGIFWVNDSVNQYFSHDIYLLPGQMIPEHSHVETKFPAKFESWMVRNGMCYNFTEVGEPAANAPVIPASQQATTISKNFKEQHVGEVIHLAGKGTWHFLYAGDQGAIVHEYANYHDGAGLRFTNPKAKL